MRLGTVSKVQVKVLNHEPEEENEDFNIRKVITKGLWIDSDEKEEEEEEEGEIFDVDYDKVRAIGDIMLVDLQDDEKQN
ncbi:MAG: hypothetical protein FWH29_08655 [Methanobrevibacter sp.]|nr:hypothetical protein [Methanobrevibacter sp.]